MEKTNENNEEYLEWLMDIKTPENDSDPYVIIDPELQKAEIVTRYIGEETQNLEFEKTMSDAILVPLINLNGMNLDEDKIESVEIFYNEFAPKLILIVNDPNKDTQFVGSPGLNNAVTVILTCPSNGMYKKISLLFYIKEIISLDESLIKYECEYFNPNLNKITFGQIGEDKLTTFEFCEEIAKTLKIGFAATDGCKDVSDAKWRQAYSERLRDFIYDQVKCGGLDEESIFDCWIDLFGYLVLVNFNYVMHYKAKLDNYSILAPAGIKTTIKITDEETNQPIKVKRILTNNPDLPFSQLKIVDTQNNLYTHNTQNTGSLKRFWILNSAGDANLLEKKEIQMIEDSVEGVLMTHAYESTSTEFLGAEMADDTPCLFQKHVREMCLCKYRSRQLTVDLAEANYGIQRGTLVYVSIIETDINKKQLITLNNGAVSTSNIYSKIAEKADGNEDVDVIPVTDVQPQSAAEIVDQDNFVANPALSGFYYVDSLVFRYVRGSNVITESLNLIKKDIQASLINTINAPNIPQSMIEETTDENAQ